MGLTRRGFLGAAGLAAAGPVPPASAHPADLAGGPLLRDLPEDRGRRGLLGHALTMPASTVDVGGRRVRVDTYDGLLPGPLLRVRPGDRVRLRLTNLMRPMGVPPGATPPPAGHAAGLHPDRARRHAINPGTRPSIGEDGLDPTEVRS